LKHSNEKKLNEKMSIGFSVHLILETKTLLKKNIFGVPHLATYIFLSFQLLNEPRLGGRRNRSWHGFDTISI